MVHKYPPQDNPLVGQSARARAAGGGNVPKGSTCVPPALCGRDCPHYFAVLLMLVTSWSNVNETKQIRRVGEFFGCWSGTDSIIFYVSFMTNNGRNLLAAEPQRSSWSLQVAANCWRGRCRCNHRVGRANNLKKRNKRLVFLNMVHE